MRGPADEVGGRVPVFDQAQGLFTMQPGALDEVQQLVAGEVLSRPGVVFRGRFVCQDSQIDDDVVHTVVLPCSRRLYIYPSLREWSDRFMVHDKSARPAFSK